MNISIAGGHAKKMECIKDVHMKSRRSNERLRYGQFRLYPLILCWLPVTCSVNFVIKLVVSANITPIRKPPIDTTKNEANARPICSAFTSPLSKLCIVRYKTTDAASKICIESVKSL